MGGSSSRVTIGYKYYMGMHLAICHGPVDAVEAIIVGERTAFSGNVTVSSAISIDQPNLFGGEKKEGGIQGTVDIAMGEDTQGKNAYLMGQLGSDIPAFRGTLTLVLRKMYLTAMTRNIKPWAIRVRRAAAVDWYAAKASIVGVGSPGEVGFIPPNSANGVHIIYEALSNTDWGLGLPATLVNSTSFMAAADILYDENFGLSMMFAKQTSVEDFITNIIQHIGAVIYTDNSTGQFTIKLIRQPSQDELDNAVVFNSSNILEHRSFERPSFAEMINEVIVNYRPQGARKDSALTLQDLASVDAQLGLVSQTVQFPGIDNATIAARVGARELSQYSTPLAKVQFECNRDGWDVNPGDIVKYNNPELGITNLIVRVFSMNFGTLLNGEITIDGTQDIYTMPETSYLASQETAWVEPIQDPLPSPSTSLFEIPYFEIANNFSEGDQATFDEFTAYLQALVQEPPSASASFQLWLSPDATISNYTFDVDGNYTPSVEIVTALSIPKNLGEATETLSFTSGTGTFFDITEGTYAYVDSEVIEIISMDVNASTITIRRAVLDTLPQTHVANSIVFFAEEGNTQASQQYLADPTGSGGGDTAYTRMLTQTDIGVLPINDSVEFTHTFTGRQTKPFPPSAVRLDNKFFPVALAQLNSESFAIGWKSRNRKLQITKPFASWYNETVVGIVEPTSDFYINYYGEENTLLEVEKVLGLTMATNYGTTYNETRENRASGFTLPGTYINLDAQGGAAQTGDNTVTFSLTDTSATARPDLPLFHSDKVYLEFTADTDSFLVGVSGNDAGIRQQDTANVSYLQYQDDTLVGSITGTIGAGLLHGGTAGVAIDQGNLKFWLRNIDGSWRDGDPATNTGGFSFSTLVTGTITGQTFYHLAFANDTTTLPQSNTIIETNLGRVAFTHTIPAGFVSYNSPPTGRTQIDTVDIGLGFTTTLEDDGLTFTSLSPPTWTRIKIDRVKTEGRFYSEVIIKAIPIQTNFGIGVQPGTFTMSGFGTVLGMARWMADGKVNVDSTVESDIDSYTVGDRVGVAVDYFAGEVRFFKNGGAVGSVYTLTISADAVPMCIMLSSGHSATFSHVYQPTTFDDPSPPFKYGLYDLYEGETVERKNGSLRIEMYTTRDVTIDLETELIESLVRFDHTTNRNGWGYRYGEYYGGGDVL
ncbi:MAG: hypothetical protein COA47_09940 [Robiginitomaculum sp.]|nr:MAG: hypothetical protein COA47_09940 [Robiginitomaculum sp.]